MWDGVYTLYDGEREREGKRDEGGIGNELKEGEGGDVEEKKRRREEEKKRGRRRMEGGRCVRE